MSPEPWKIVCYTTDPDAVRDVALVLGIPVAITSAHFIHGLHDIYMIECPLKHLSKLRTHLGVRLVK